VLQAELSRLAVVAWFLFALTSVIVAVFVVVAYRARWQWTGLPEIRRVKYGDEDVQPAKTLWDWLQLFVIPLVLAGLVFLLNSAQAQRDQRHEDERAAQQREIAKATAQKENIRVADAAREETLRGYLTQMSDLMLDRRLLRSKRDEDVREVARTATLTAVRRLDGERRALVVRFLAEAELVMADEPKVELRDADLTSAKLQSADLQRTGLDGADLRRAVLQRADLRRAHLEGADLRRAVLKEADLESAHLGGADLRAAKLSGANLTAVDFRGANLRRVSLAHVELWRSNFAGADLSGADLRGAALGGAHMEHVRLQYADLNNAQMGDVVLLGGASAGREPSLGGTTVCQPSAGGFAKSTP
jgi:uncharacterized protein YjbI with pentapeptide repeats